MMLTKIQFIKILSLVFFVTFTFFNGCKSIDNQDLRPLALNPSFKILNDSIVEFKVDVKRNLEVEGEYFPSSERLRVEILDLKGNLIWSSVVGKQFFMAIGKVEPLLINTEKSYKIEFNLNSIKDYNFKKEQVSINFILPVNPNIYIENLKLFLK